MKFTVAILALVCFLLTSSAFTPEEYEGFIDELMKNDELTDEYQTWAAELFSDPDYLYGGKNGPFPCSVPKNINPPRNIHELRPIDVTCVGALGDSLTAGLGAHAITPLGLIIENRGISWSMGGDKDYTRVLTLPNIIREYQKGLQGQSTKIAIIYFNAQNASNNGLNTARSGDVTYHMPGQAGMLLERIQKKKICDLEKDWKVVTFFVGGNDLCVFCNENLPIQQLVNNYIGNITQTLDILHANLPRTLVNLVPMFDISQVERLNSGGLVCQYFHKKTCPCAAYPTDDQRVELAQLFKDFQNGIISLAQSGRYDDKDDFTVVVQPFFTQTILPNKAGTQQPDFSLFAPDCFHFSGKGHKNAGLSLWNNMIEPVGGKQTNWHFGESLKCPSDKYPYIFTSKNSAGALADGFNMNLNSASDDTSTNKEEVAQTTRQARSSTTSKQRTGPSETSRRQTTPHVKPSKGPHDRDKHHRSSKTSSAWSMVGFIAIVCIFVFLLILLIVSAVKRRNNRASMRSLNGSQYSDDTEVEIYGRPLGKTSLKSNEKLPNTYGSRINFE